MIKRTVEISQQPVHVTVRNEQLLLLRKDNAHRRLPVEPETLLAEIPCEDIGLVLVEHAGTTYSHAALATLLKYDAAVVICGRNHLPAGLLLPLGEHTTVVWRLRDQLAVKRPMQKQLWRQLVQAKIRAQAANLAHDSPIRRKLLTLVREVRSGDPSNVEAQAARAYWPAMFGETFRRDTDGDGINGLLNYGYAVLRAAVARAIVSAGLLPAIGIHHANRGNAFCLADDLVEPLRPIVDLRIRALWAEGENALTPVAKQAVLRLLTSPVRCGEQGGPLMVAVHRMVASLVRCFEGSAKRIEIPVAVDPAAVDVSAAGEAEPADG